MSTVTFPAGVRLIGNVHRPVDPLLERAQRAVARQRAQPARVAARRRCRAPHVRWLAARQPHAEAAVREHYAPPWRLRDLAYAVVGVAACFALVWLAAQGLN